MATVDQTIDSALRMVGLIGPGHTFSSPMSGLRVAAIDILNTMLQSWGVDGINVSAEQPSTFDVTASQGQYTVGSGGLFNMARPAFISKATRLRSGFEYEMYHMRDAEYQEWPTKNLTGWPFAWHYKNLAPMGVFSLIRVPSETFQVVLYSPILFSTYTAGSNTVNLADGYDQAIRSNLALLFLGELSSLGAKMDSVVLDMVQRTARDSKANIRRLNYRIPLLESDLPGYEYGWDDGCEASFGGGTSDSDMRLITVSGTTDGVNLTFTLSPTPTVAISLDLYVNGVAQLQGTHYTLSGSTVTFDPLYAPALGATLWGFATV